MAGALDGLRVIDMTSVVMGPTATQLLGDYGADIIKVEAPSGDTARQVTPLKHEGMGYSYLTKNRNKRSIVLDLKQPDHHAALEKLLETADIFVYSARPQAMARNGLTPARFAELNPRLISVSLVGYGEGGPYSGPPGLRGPDPGPDVRPLPAGAGRIAAAAVRSALVQRPRGRHLRGRADDDRAASPRQHRRGPAHRGADVRDHGPARHRGPRGRHGVDPADRPARLPADPHPGTPPVPDQGRPHLRHRLHRQPVARVRRSSSAARACSRRTSGSARSGPAPRTRTPSTPWSARRC